MNNNNPPTPAYPLDYPCNPNLGPAYPVGYPYPPPGYYNYNPYYPPYYPNPYYPNPPPPPPPPPARQPGPQRKAHLPKQAPLEKVSDDSQAQLQLPVDSVPTKEEVQLWIKNRRKNYPTLLKRQRPEQSFCKEEVSAFESKLRKRAKLLSADPREVKALQKGALILKKRIMSQPRPIQEGPQERRNIRRQVDDQLNTEDMIKELKLKRDKTEEDVKKAVEGRVDKRIYCEGLRVSLCLPDILRESCYLLQIVRHLARRGRTDPEEVNDSAGEYLGESDSQEGEVK